MKPLQILLLLAAAMAATSATQPFYDRKHFSKVLGEERNYRILLPPDYESSGRRYPVIYYFHGHSDRYSNSYRYGYSNSNVYRHGHRDSGSYTHTNTHTNSNRDSYCHSYRYRYWYRIRSP